MTYLVNYMAEMTEMYRQAKERPAVVERILKTPPKLDYTKLIHDWWHSMAPATRNHPWSIETIMAAAFKDKPRRPALRCVAAALRTAGWTERRDWTRAGRNRRYWLPPTNA